MRADVLLGNHMYLASNFGLKLKTDQHGIIAIRSDSIALGLAIVVLGALWAYGFVTIMLGFHDTSPSTLALVAGGALVLLLGIRLLFTGTRVAFDKRAGYADWRCVGIFRASRSRFALSDLQLVLHRSRVPNGLLNRDGFALSLIGPDGKAVQLARNKHVTAVNQYAQKLQKNVPIRVKDLTAEQELGGDG
ncbi:MAG: hypothetical protein E4H02_10750 [Lentisphaerales bacterium]|nr:MAG: hypothetical protein E4H02_10750 [Lentisphaerales bacterium]